MQLPSIYGLFLMVIVGWSSLVMAQPDNHQYILTKKLYGVEDGLASREVFCALQDHDGFMWFGTRNGLDRYDGKNFKLYTKDRNGLADNKIIRLAQDSHHRLIITYGHPGYLNSAMKFEVMDVKTGQLQTLKQAYPNLPFKEDYTYWVVNDGEDLCFLTAHPYQYWRLSGDTFSLMCEMKLWDDGTQHGEEYKTKNAPFYSRTGRKCIFSKNYASLFNSAELPAYFVTPDTVIANRVKGQHRIFSITPNHEFRYEVNNRPYLMDGKGVISKLDSSRTEPMFKDRYHMYVLQSNKGELFLHDQHAGLYYYDFHSFHPITTLAELNMTNSEGIYHAYTDNQDIHWICTSNGVLKVILRKNPFTHYFTKSQLQDSSDNQVRGIYVDQHNHVFANVWTTLFINNRHTAIPSKDILYAIHQHNNAIVVGSNAISTLKHNQLLPLKNYWDKDEIWSIDSINQQEILIGRSHSLSKYNVVTEKMIPIQYPNEGIPKVSFVYRFLHRKNKHIWAIAQNGCYELDAQAERVIRYIGEIQTGQKIKGAMNTSVKIQNILDGYEDEHQILWIATNGEGLYRWDETHHHLQNFRINSGLPSDILYRIEPDEFNNLWISTDNGLVRFNKNTFKVSSYNTSTGITHNEFNRISSFKAGDGRLYFGGLDGVNAFYPKDFIGDSSNTQLPIRIISLNQFSGKNKRLLDYTDKVLRSNKIVLEPNDGFFNLEFKLLDFNEGKINYAYKIEGMDANWNVISENSLRISGLPTGDFTLRIRAQSPNGQWSKKELSIPIQVLAPFYQSRWFLGLMIALLGLFLFWMIRWRTRNLLISKKALERTVDKRTEQLKMSLDEKEILLREVHHRVKNNLEVISSLLELQGHGISDDKAKEAILAGQSRVQSIALIHHQLYQNSHVTQLDFHAFVRELYQQVLAVFLLDDEEADLVIQGEPLWLDIDVAVPLGLIINELMTNSFKYAKQKGKVLLLNLHIQPPSPMEALYTLVYQDNGLGFPEGMNMEESQTLGMRIIHLLTRQLGGKVKRYNQEGSVFEIPFYKNKIQRK